MNYHPECLLMLPTVAFTGSQQASPASRRVSELRVHRIAHCCCLLSVLRWLARPLATRVGKFNFQCRLITSLSGAMRNDLFTGTFTFSPLCTLPGSRRQHLPEPSFGTVCLCTFLSLTVAIQWEDCLFLSLSPLASADCAVILAKMNCLWLPVHLPLISFSAVCCVL